MKITLNISEILYLKSFSFLEDLNSNNEEIGSLSIDIDNDIADRIRDWAGDRLQQIGFNEDYSLTDEGKILEDLIDKLYH